MTADLEEWEFDDPAEVLERKRGERCAGCEHAVPRIDRLGTPKMICRKGKNTERGVGNIKERTMSNAGIAQDDGVAALERPAAEKLFRTLEDALRFAFNYSMQQQGRPLADRMASPGGRTSKGLSGNDGAAQAGMIWSELKQLSEVERAILIARLAPKDRPCTCKNPCCSGYTPNEEWMDAIRTLEQAALTMLSGHVSNYRLRRLIVEKAVGVKVEIKTLAKQCGVAEKTAGVHWRIIKEWMNGTPARHPISRADRARSEYADVGNAEESTPAVDGLISTARKNADKLLSTLDFIGED